MYSQANVFEPFQLHISTNVNPCFDGISIV